MPSSHRLDRLDGRSTSPEGLPVHFGTPRQGGARKRPIPTQEQAGEFLGSCPVSGTRPDPRSERASSRRARRDRRRRLLFPGES
jgi:hypothetical protein